MTYEYCCKCDCKTGRAGAGDDSLYTEHDGPFCENCFLKQEAQPAQQEPVAWLYPEGLEALKAGKCWTAYGTKQDDNCNIPVHLNAAVAPKVEPVKTECDGFDSHPAAPVQEPAAWGIDWGKAGDIPCVSIIQRLPDGGIHVVAVEYAPYSYTTPPAAQRQWRGLTDKEFEEIIMSAPNATVPVMLWQLIQDKLKEKNQ